MNMTQYKEYKVMKRQMIFKVDLYQRLYNQAENKTEAQYLMLAQQEVLKAFEVLNEKYNLKLDIPQHLIIK